MDEHPYQPHDSFDGGDLDCGNGLLLLIRKHIDPLTPGQLLEILSTESSVVEDLPAWCRLTKNELVSHIRRGRAEQFSGFQRTVPRAGRPGADTVTCPEASAQKNANAAHGQGTGADHPADQRGGYSRPAAGSLSPPRLLPRCRS